MTSTQLEVTTLGELLLRFSVPAGYRLESARRLNVSPAGAEANVAVALARLGHRAGWIGSLPANPVGRMVTNEMQAARVDLSKLLWRDSGRVGTFYVEFSLPPRAIQVYYDRADSCMSHMTVDDIDWDYLLSSKLIHLSGITPALSRSCGELMAQVVKRAKAAKVPISFDVNFRSKLWTAHQARRAIEPLIENADLLFCSERDAQQLFDSEGSPEEIAHALIDHSRARNVIVTLGEKGAAAWDGKQFIREPAVPVQIIDRFGAGDALAAGVIHGWLENDLRLGLRYGVLLAALVLSQFGDMLTTTPEELKALLSHTNGGLER